MRSHTQDLGAPVAGAQRRSSSAIGGRSCILWAIVNNNWKSNKFKCDMSDLNWAGTLYHASKLMDEFGSASHR